MRKSMCVYVYVRVCMRACVCVCMRACARVCVCACMHVCVRAHEENDYQNNAYMNFFLQPK